MATYTKKYNPNRSAEWNYRGEKWRLSRSKIDLFIECPRCFYLDNKLGTKRPSMPSFTLNVAVDTLLKREFDHFRKEQTAHPLMEQYAIDAVPYIHKDIDIWRDNFAGIAYQEPETGLVVSGAVDDIWVTPLGSLIVVDYKATSKEGTIESLADSAWEDQYRRQVGVYQWILEKNGFPVSKTAYFVYANGKADEETFQDTLNFETTLIPCEGDTTWIPSVLKDIKACLESTTFPKSGDSCEFCPYREACGKKLQQIHHEHSKK